VQIAALTGALAVLVWSVGGLIVNPDFATGDSATAETVLGSDMNGWHALSGFLIVVPALALLRGNPRTLALFLLVAASSLTATALWAFASERPGGGLFYFPNNEIDALLHIAVSAVFVAGAVSELRAARREGSIAVS
jgi:hypothetical protein